MSMPPNPNAPRLVVFHCRHCGFTTHIGYNGQLVSAAGAEPCRFCQITALEAQPSTAMPVPRDTTAKPSNDE